MAFESIQVYKKVFCYCAKAFITILKILLQTSFTSVLQTKVFLLNVLVSWKFNKHDFNKKHEYYDWLSSFILDFSEK